MVSIGLSGPRTGTSGAMAKERKKRSPNSRVDRGSFVRGALMRCGWRLEPRRSNWRAPDPVRGHGSHHNLLKLTSDRHPRTGWQKGRIHKGDEARAGRRGDTRSGDRGGWRRHAKKLAMRAKCVTERPRTCLEDKGPHTTWEIRWGPDRGVTAGWCGQASRCLSQ